MSAPPWPNTGNPRCSSRATKPAETNCRAGYPVVHDGTGYPARQFVSAGFVAREEHRGLPVFGQGGADILVLNSIQDGRDAIADVTVVNSQRADLTVAAAVQPCHAARQAEHCKHLKYGEACANLTMNLLPLAIELDGSFGPTLVSIIARCRDSIADVCPVSTTSAAATYSQYWTQRLSVTLRRGTAAPCKRLLGQTNAGQRVSSRSQTTATANTEW